MLLYQVETIGDAYCVAGGLHRKSPYNALQIAWMALRMMDYANQQKSHDGNTIQVNLDEAELELKLPGGEDSIASV